jgi:hypothetical protein
MTPFPALTAQLLGWGGGLRLTACGGRPGKITYVRTGGALPVDDVEPAAPPPILPGEKCRLMSWWGQCSEPLHRNYAE